MRFVYALRNKIFFRPQLRALLRASVYGKLNIMFPMVATINEFREAKAILLEEKKTLKMKVMTFQMI
ncbi:Phosphoenolpyruvate-protein phosphotransferase of PTS system [Staphylococcus aureus]|uniref:Phosphoenolpyruvate-protein phosphotransferase of PTS system n=1 Tax=Staphylococcus aureus TaxID=1280 RepID=A0A380DNN3_STAAU|nr:Phosphoenolpyruvate-protein phosphotransferase of PTS system [Staphylococcus aureus]